jgi:hypothetical protein
MSKTLEEVAKKHFGDDVNMDAVCKFVTEILDGMSVQVDTRNVVTVFASTVGIVPSICTIGGGGGGGNAGRAATGAGWTGPTNS